MSTAKPSTDAEEFSRYAEASRALYLAVHGKLMAIELVLRALLAAAGGQMPAAERNGWLRKLYALGRVFNESGGGAIFADASAAELLDAASLARAASNNFKAFVDSVAAAMPAEDA